MTNSSTQATGGQGLAVAALVLGIISASLSLLWFISIILGILAIIFGAVALKSPGRKKAMAGIVTGIVGIVFSIFIFFIVFLALPSLQAGQRDTATKNDIASLMSDIASYQAMNSGQLPDASELSAADLTNIYVVGSGDEPLAGKATYNVGVDCNGRETTQRDYSISTLLENKSVYCSDN